jgi:hypothetical protein
MEQSPQYSFDLLVDPAAVLAAAERAAKWDLPRRICRPLDRRHIAPVSTEVADFDADVEGADELDLDSNSDE